MFAPLPIEMQKIILRHLNKINESNENAFLNTTKHHVCLLNSLMNNHVFSTDKYMHLGLLFPF